MAVQDWGFVPLGQGVGNALAQIANLKMEQQRTNEFSRRTDLEAQQNAFRQQLLADEQGQQHAERRKADIVTQLNQLYPRVSAGDASAIQAAAQLVGELSPEAGQALMSNPANLETQAFAAGHSRIPGVAATPGPITAQQFPGIGAGLMQDGKLVPGAFRTAPQPQQYGPESFSPFTQADGTVVLVGNRGTMRPTDMKGQVKPAETDVKAAEQKARTEQAWALYEAARDGLITGLSGS